ncbi:S1C family serine protease [Amycolatopsis nigrescens]|uniref:S1C family serine protease n=1 Tax=Amycolatopsis nigrescens TaxID=381445 RepID=UPI0003673E63|nr:trypsin-like peptidase domain-containing protein [Amycolatopsis nigrescens]
MTDNEFRQGPAGGPQPHQQQPHPQYAQPPYSMAGNPLFRPVPPNPPPRKGKRVALMVSAAAVAAALVGGVTGAAIVGSGDGGTGSIGTGTAATGQLTSNSVSDVSGVAAQVLPSVVQVNVQTARGTAIGSGVILSQDGKILTNAHVVEGASGDVTVTLSDGKKYQASVLGADPTADIAVLQAKNASGLTAAKLGDSSALKVGQEVVAIGSPGGLQNTVTSGIVSATNRQLSDLGQQRPQANQIGDSQDQPSYTAIQTDAAINQGNSGGALVNSAGEVVGINTSIYSPSGGSIGIGFAIPINDAKTIVAKIGG